MVSQSVSWPQTLEHLLNGGVLVPDQAAALMRAWLSEELTPVQTGAFLAAIRSRGVNGGELGAMAAVLRDLPWAQLAFGAVAASAVAGGDLREGRRGQRAPELD